MLFEDTYQSIKAPSEGIYKDRGSKFIGFAFPIKTEAAVKEHLHLIKKEHAQANHHCYAFRLSPDPTVYRASDDREPSGSAGKPILGAINSLQLTDVLVVVVRYFGGSLLGVPGLINAYRSAAVDALHHAEIIEKTIDDHYEIQFSYECINDVHALLKGAGARIVFQDYAEPCIIHFDIRISKSSILADRIKEHPVLAIKASLKHR
ncbi:YigZ family protein [soil metagenome]